MENDLSSKCNQKIRGSYIYFRQNRLKNDFQKWQRRFLHNEEGDNPSRSYNNGKYMVNIEVPKWIKQILTDLTRKTLTVVGNLILYSQKWIDHSDREYKNHTDLNKTINHMNLSNICRIFYSRAVGWIYTLFNPTWSIC